MAGLHHVVTLPPGVRSLVERGIAQVRPDRVLLFGSRARGDARCGSDFDVAFAFAPDRRPAFARFCADAADSELTLHDIDWVDLGAAPAALRAQIEAEGKVLYADREEDRELRAGAAQARGVRRAPGGE